MTTPVPSCVPPIPDRPTPGAADVPPPFFERAIGALVADARLREAVLGDLAEGFAERWACDGPGPARRGYREEAARSASALLATTWWPAPRHRARRLRSLLAAGVGGAVLLQLFHQAAQLVVALTLAAAGLTGSGWPLAAGSLAAAAGCGALAGAVAARGIRRAPLAGALALAAACAVLAVAGMLANGGMAPLWYWGGLQLVTLPGAVCAGGLLCAVRTPATPAGAS